MNSIQLPEGVVLQCGQGGMPMVRVDADGGSAEIYLQGAHVTHFQRNGEAPLLFLSRESKFTAGTPIRGGIPIIFPWFGAKEGAPAHGFARNRTWELAGVQTGAGGEIALRLKLPDGLMQDGPEWTIEYIVTVGAALMLELLVTNASTRQEFTFENCLHTYFIVGDVDAVSIVGLNGVKYRDKVENFAEKTESNPAIIFKSEVDRVYVDTTATVEIHDPKLRRKIIVEKTGSASTVVWNPWIEKSKQMSDFGDEEYQNMVCVESGNVGKNLIILKPGGTSSLKVKLTNAAM